ncbi:MAG TPA: Rieske 2Fe-2S domain-containing protein [Candidatus Acidoferrum sp.]|nr:Rieske 2Fe-2S domain-containing protein [Candidatus Acidoferrum sp.]
MAFLRAAKTSQIAPGTIREIEVGGKTIALANVAGKFHAIDNTCLHQGGPLGEGELEGAVVTCPWHGWQFDLTSGKIVQDPSAPGVACYEVLVQGDEILVNVG